MKGLRDAKAREVVASSWANSFGSCIEPWLVLFIVCTCPIDAPPCSLIGGYSPWGGLLTCSGTWAFLSVSEPSTVAGRPSIGGGPGMVARPLLYIGGQIFSGSLFPGVRQLGGRTILTWRPMRQGFAWACDWARIGKQRESREEEA